MIRKNFLAAAFAATALLMLVIGASSAQAVVQSTVGLSDNGDGTTTLQYLAPANQSNELTIRLDNGAYVVQDTGVSAIGDGDGAGGCAVSAPTLASCPASGVSAIDVEAGNGADVVDLCANSDAGACASSTNQDISVDVRIDGGSGKDTITGGVGNNLLFGGAGGDTLNGTVGNDTVSYDEPNRTRGVTAILPAVGSHTDTNGEPSEQDIFRAAGGGGIDNVIGTDNDDTLIGNNLSNVFKGRGGADKILGLGGLDRVDYSDHAGDLTVNADSTVTVPLPPAVPTIGANPTPDGASGENDNIGNDIESITGGPGNDVLTGSADNGVIDGGPGNDLLDGGFGSDVLLGGPGTDTVSYAGRSEPVSISTDDNGDDGSANDGPPLGLPGPRDSIGADVEIAIGGSNADTITGDARNNVFAGGPGDDTIAGGGGDDTIDGGSGNDTIGGGSGSDAIAGGDNNDTIAGGDGNDSLDGGNGDDSLDGGSGADAIAGGTGNDVADYSSRLVPVAVSADGVGGDGAAGENDSVAVDVEGINGGSAGDVLRGGAGNGTITGGDGDDVLSGGDGSDTLVGGAGSDTADYSDRSAAVAVDLNVAGGDGQAGENDDVRGDVERVAGGSGDDTLIGNAGSNMLDGGPGNDTLRGGGDFDQLTGGPGNDALAGDAGTDIVLGGSGDDSLFGGDDADTLNGNDGNDLLDGGNGADNLAGGAGTDVADYSSRTAPLDISLDGAANDGQAGEGDDVEPDVESVTAGSGDDKIDSNDGLKGAIDCGAGDDTLLADNLDQVTHCEKLTVASAGRSNVTIASGAVKASRNGAISINVTCPGAAASTCNGSLRLETAGAVSASKKKRKLSLGSASFSVPAGQTRAVKIRLSSKARKLLKKKHKLRAKATASVDGLDPTTQQITIKAGKR